MSLLATSVSPLQEIIGVHKCLEAEVRQLHSCAQTYQASCLSESPDMAQNLRSLKTQFDFLFLVYLSHSTAEDDIIMPALSKRGLDAMASEELEQQHTAQSKCISLFLSISLYFLLTYSLSYIHIHTTSPFIHTFTPHLTLPPSRNI